MEELSSHQSIPLQMTTVFTSHLKTNHPVLMKRKESLQCNLSAEEMITLSLVWMIKFGTGLLKREVFPAF